MRSAFHAAATRCYKSPHRLPLWKACSTSTCFESCSGNTMHGFCLHFALLPKCPFLSSCKGPTLVSNMAHKPWTSTPTALTSVGMHVGYDAILHKTRPYETTQSFCLSFQDYKPKGTHMACTQPLVIAFEIYLHSLWGVNLCQNRNHRLSDHKTGELSIELKESLLNWL